MSRELRTRIPKIKWSEGTAEEFALVVAKMRSFAAEVAQEKRNGREFKVDDLAALARQRGLPHLIPHMKYYYPDQWSDRADLQFPGAKYYETYISFVDSLPPNLRLIIQSHRMGTVTSLLLPETINERFPVDLFDVLTATINGLVAHSMPYAFGPAHRIDTEWCTYYCYPTTWVGIVAAINEGTLNEYTKRGKILMAAGRYKAVEVVLQGDEATGVNTNEEIVEFVTPALLQSHIVKVRKRAGEYTAQKLSALFSKRSAPEVPRDTSFQ